MFLRDVSLLLHRSWSWKVRSYQSCTVSGWRIASGCWSELAASPSRIRTRTRLSTSSAPTQTLSTWFLLGFFFLLSKDTLMSVVWNSEVFSLVQTVWQVVLLQLCLSVQQIVCLGPLSSGLWFTLLLVVAFLQWTGAKGLLEYYR